MRSGPHTAPMGMRTLHQASSARYVMIGDPIDHVRTPRLLKRVFDDAGPNNVEISSRSVPEDDLICVIDDLRMDPDVKGIMVTSPHKSRVPELVDELTSTARLAGSVNCIRRHGEDGDRWFGAQFDGVGLVRALLDHDVDLTDSRALLLGTGGAARAIALALSKHPLRHLWIGSRSSERARRLAQAVERQTGRPASVANSDHSQQYDLVVNATILGMKPTDPSPFAGGCLEPGMVIADIVADPLETRLVGDAVVAGCRVITGRHMVQGQVMPIFEFFRGLRSDEFGESDPQ